ncbi:MipA/OmpV family protein [Ideonella sp. A 288]|uniref:MipA/OmpV family protein n=1 Tax=Ideonella sp. A 288 TaxID=1962181 RepID=UPI000B4C0CCD|nr:MipA/OmpV family protein [Ideonella sp. A 288]
MRLSLALACALVAPTAFAESAVPTEPAHWEGAVGLIVHQGPTYLGAADTKVRATPGLFLRYGRFTITTTSGFVSRRNEEIDRGLTAELVERGNLRVSLSARMDGGRDADVDPALAGLPDLRPTVRLRLSAVKRFDDGWRLAAGVSPDLLGRGGGALVDLGISHEWRLSPTLQSTVGVGTTWANRRYQQSYFGITPSQSLSSGHPVYEPGAGLRDVAVNAGLRAELSPRWIGLASVGANVLQGPAVDSPLTRRRTNWGVSGGLAWRF